MGTEPCTRDFVQDIRRMNGNNLRTRGGSILVTVTPTPGHVNPMLAIACHLRDQGHSILFNTAEVFRKQVESEGLRFVPLIGKANFDYRTFNKFIPEGQTLTPGPKKRFITSSMCSATASTLLGEIEKSAGGLCHPRNCSRIPAGIPEMFLQR